MDHLLVCLRHTQNDERNEGHSDLDADGIFRFPQQMLDFQRLLDPFEEQLDCPAALVEIGDLVRCGVQIVRQDTQDLARFGANRDLAHGFAERVLAVSGLACRKKTDAIRQDAAVVSSVAPSDRSCVTVSGV